MLVRQYRPAIGREMWEVPAGKLEAGEDPLDCATRESCIEETGYRAQRLRKLWTFFTAPGFCTELLAPVRRRGADTRARQRRRKMSRSKSEPLKSRKRGGWWSQTNCRTRRRKSR